MPHACSYERTNLFLSGVPVDWNIFLFLPILKKGINKYFNKTT